MANSLSRLTVPSLNALVMKVAIVDGALELSRLKDYCDEIGETQKDRKTFREEQMALAKEAAEKAKKVDGWSVFMKFVGYFAGVASIISGAVLLATGAGTAAGVALIVTGALTLGSRILIESGVTRLIAERASQGNAHKAAKLMSQIDLGLNISTTILALGTMLLNIAQVASAAGKIINGTLQGVQAGLQGIGQIGTGVAEKEQSDVTAKSGFVSAKIEQSTRLLTMRKTAATEQTDKSSSSLALAYLQSLEKRIQHTFNKHAAAAA
jgi:hypothetical protein